MAKGNMLLGYAQGVVGSLVFKRFNGKQVTAPRVTPPNPNTDGQLIQRAAMATVMQAYSAGKAIFDHSFEGQNVPAGSQRRFMSKNIKLLREAIASDLTNGTSAANCLGAVVARGAAMATPWPYLISEGSLFQSLFYYVEDSSLSDVIAASLPQAESASETVADYAARVGLVEGEIYTICVMANMYNTIDYTTQPTTQFGFLRLIVKSGLDSVTTLVSAATYSTLFDIDASGVIDTDFLDEPVSGQISIADIVAHAQMGCMGIIRSNTNSGLRSTSRMYFWDPADNEEYLVPNNGIKTTSLLTAWNPNATSLTDSDLILEGGDF